MVQSNLLGTDSIPMKTKYDTLAFEEKILSKDIKRLINQLWKLIPMRENEEPWQSQIDKVLIEIVGLEELFNNKLNLLIIISNLEGLRSVEVNFIQYRKTIFNLIRMMNEVSND